MTDDHRSPDEAVTRQVDAYNEADLEAFADCYAEDAVVRSLGEGERTASGRGQIRDRWGDLFENAPDLHCEVTDRFSVGPFVACRETVTGMGPDAVEAVAVYRVEDGRIQELWLGHAE
jgi:hypothetical protein